MKINKNAWELKRDRIIQRNKVEKEMRKEGTWYEEPKKDTTRVLNPKPPKTLPDNFDGAGDYKDKFE